MNPPQTHYSSLSIVVRLYYNTIFLGQKTPAGLESACLKWDQSSFPLISTFPFLMLPSSLSLVFIVYTLILYTFTYKYGYMCRASICEAKLKEVGGVMSPMKITPHTRTPWRKVQGRRRVHHLTSVLSAKLYICATQGRLLDGQPWGRMRSMLLSFLSYPQQKSYSLCKLFLKCVCYCRPCHSPHSAHQNLDLTSD